MATIFDLLADYGNHFIASQNNDPSYGGEYACLKNLFARFDIRTGYVVDIAASDGITQSCTLGFFRDPNWAGLAVEMDPIKFSKLAFIYSGFPKAKLARSRITPGNVGSILRGFEVPTNFTLLNLDIDSYDLYVIDELLKSEYRPQFISMEVNEKIPPPLFFTVDFDETHFWQQDHFYGCSLTAACEVVKPYGYVLESLQYANAIFVRADIARNSISDLSAEAAYEIGYRTKPDRRTLFSYNANVDCLLSLSPEGSIRFLNDFFKKYQGKYTLR